MRKTIVLCTIGLLFCLQSEAQTNSNTEKKKELKSVANATLVTEKNTTTTQKSTAFIEGTIPTPEDQGYIKTSVNGKETYVKEQGQLFLQYDPKK